MNEIEVIWKFLDNLDEYVYATDIETDELVYMNRKLLEVYGLQSIDDVKGMKCYEVLQKSSVPCGMCNNDRLCAGKFVEWRYYNPVIDKYMMLKDTLVEDPVTNKKYRIEISIDISEERSQDKMIQKYRDMESFVNEALKDALSVESPDETIRIILEYLGKVLNGERTYILRRTEMAGMIIHMNGRRRECHRRSTISRIFRRRSVRTGITFLRRENMSRYRILRRCA